MLAWTVLAQSAPAFSARGGQFRRHDSPIRLCIEAVTPPAAPPRRTRPPPRGASAIPGDLHGQYHIFIAVPVA